MKKKYVERSFLLCACVTVLTGCTEYYPQSGENAQQAQRPYQNSYPEGYYGGAYPEDYGRYDSAPNGKTKIRGSIKFQQRGGGTVVLPDGTWVSGGNDIHMQAKSTITEGDGYTYSQRKDTELNTGDSITRTDAGYPYQRRADEYRLSRGGDFRDRSGYMFNPATQSGLRVSNTIFTCNNPTERLTSSNDGYYFCKGYSETPMNQNYGQPAQGYRRMPSSQSQLKW